MNLNENISEVSASLEDNQRKYMRDFFVSFFSHCRGIHRHGNCNICSGTFPSSARPARFILRSQKTRRSSTGLTDTRASVTLVRTAGRSEWTRILCSVTASTSRVAAFLGPRFRSNVERLPPLQRKTQAAIKRSPSTCCCFTNGRRFPTLEATGRTQAGSATDYREETAVKDGTESFSSGLASGEPD